MRKILFLFLLMLINNVSGYQIPDNNNSNMTSIEHKVLPVIDLNYYVNSSDYIEYIEIENRINTKLDNKQYSKTVTLTDGKNVMKIFFNYQIEHKLFGFAYNVKESINVSFNNVKINKFHLGSDELKRNRYDEENFYFTSLFGIPQYTSITNKILISKSGIVFKNGLFSKSEYDFTSIMFTNRIILSNQYDDLSYNYLIFKYTDTNNNEFYMKNELDNGYNELNPIFKIVFDIVKLSTTPFKYLGFFSSDIDYFEFQKNILNPLRLLNFMLTTVILTALFFWTMGIIFSIVFVEMLIFIFSYLTCHGDILETFQKWTSNSVSFFTVVIVKPITWLWSNVVKIWS